MANCTATRNVHRDNVTVDFSASGEGLSEGWTCQLTITNNGDGGGGGHTFRSGDTTYTFTTTHHGPYSWDAQFTDPVGRTDPDFHDTFDGHDE